MTSLLRDQAFVNGEWISAGNRASFEVKNPANGKLIGLVPDMNQSDAQKAVESAHTAFKSWRATTGEERYKLLKKWSAALIDNIEAIAEILSAECGRTSIEVSKHEVLYGSEFVEFYAEEARRIHGEIIPSPTPGKKLLIEKHPIGVVALIIPWNFPFLMCVRKTATALAAGCTCVIKPAEDTPLTSLAIAHLANTIGIPKGVINVITCDRPNVTEIGKLLSESPLISGLAFTGSTQIGKLLYQQSAKHVKRVSLELGSNTPFIIFESADMDKAIKSAIISKFVNAGQVCVATNKFLIHEAIYEEFLEKFSLALDNVKPEVLINKNQFDKIVSLVEDAKDKGAIICKGGKPAKDLGELFYEPTLIIDVEDDMRVYSEEIFGPIAVVIKFKTEEEAVTIANDTEKGLAAYLFTRDVSQIFRVSNLLEAGSVCVNEAMVFPIGAPFGGIKESGIGKEGSYHGIDDFTYMKYLAISDL